MKPYFLLLLFVIFIPAALLAQKPGYVIKRNNDTIRCQVKNAMFGGPKYKTGDGFQKIKIDDIKEYQLTKDSSIHEAEVLRDGADPVFVQVLERGKICLYVEYIYTYTGTTTTTTTNWYVSKNNDPLILLKTSSLFVLGASRDERKIMFSGMLSDDPTVTAAYNAENSFSFSTIRKYINQYNKDKASKSK